MAGLAWIRAWDRWLHEPQPAVAAGTFRIALGACLAANLAALTPRWLEWFGPAGMVSPATALAINDGFRLALWRALPATDAAAWAIWALLAGAALALITGVAARPAAAVAFIGISSLYDRNPMICDSGDAALRVLLAWAAFAPIGGAYALGGSWRPASAWAPAWGLRMVQLQLAAIYLCAALSKLDGEPWLDGTAVYYALSAAEYQGWIVPTLLDSPVAIAALTWGAIALELAFPLLVWWRPARRPLVAAMIVFHLGMAVLMNLAIFQATMIAGLLAFWIPADDGPPPGPEPVLAPPSAEG